MQGSGFPHYLISQRLPHANHFWTAQHPSIMKGTEDGRGGGGRGVEAGPAWCPGSAQSPPNSCSLGPNWTLGVWSGSAGLQEIIFLSLGISGCSWWRSLEGPEN